MNWRIDPTKSVLLVLDVQEKLLPVMADGERVLGKILQMVEMAKLLDIPIVYTEQIPAKVGATVAPLKKALHGLAPLQKSEFSAVSVLPEEMPKTVLVCGLETHICVRQTVYDLRLLGKSVYVLADAVTSRSLLDHELALGELQEDKVVITSVEAISWEMVREAGTDLFRSALAILK